MLIIFSCTLAGYFKGPEYIYVEDERLDASGPPRREELIREIWDVKNQDFRDSRAMVSSGLESAQGLRLLSSTGPVPQTFQRLKHWSMLGDELEAQLACMCKHGVSLSVTIMQDPVGQAKGMGQRLRWRKQASRAM